MVEGIEMDIRERLTGEITNWQPAPAFERRKYRWIEEESEVRLGHEDHSNSEHPAAQVGLRAARKPMALGKLVGMIHQPPAEVIALLNDLEFFRHRDLSIFQKNFRGKSLSD